jgi:hypothetical protein
MSGKVRDFVDFWVENSVHAREQLRTAGASQDVTELVRRFIASAEGQGISEAELRAEIGDVAEYVRSKLANANAVESRRRKANRGDTTRA